VRPWERFITSWLATDAAQPDGAIYGCAAAPKAFRAAPPSLAVRKENARVRKRRPDAAMMAVKRLARLSIGLLVALLVFGVVPAAQSSVVPAAQSVGLKVQDRSHDNDNPDNQLYAHFQIINTGTASVSLSSLTMRYWFTNEAPTDPLVFACDYALVDCSNITSKFVVMPSPVTKANTYLEIGFTAAAGSIALGQSSGEIQTRIHHVNWSNFITTDSYSFISDPSFVYKDTQTVTLYLNGVLVWGVEPAN
jgi:Cellulose binding domain